MMIYYPEFEIKFKARVKLALYLFNHQPTILGMVKSKWTGKGKVDHSLELENTMIILDFDKEDNVIGIEIIGDCQLGEVKK
jgi:uncharacterized protein YuzE